jgi:hypothetical protein
MSKILDSAMVAGYYQMCDGKNKSKSIISWWRPGIRTCRLTPCHHTSQGVTIFGVGDESSSIESGLSEIRDLV